MTLSVDLCGVKLKNPVITASGTFGYGVEYGGYMDVSALGGICSKGLTLHPREGNYGERMVETAGGMLNSVGLQNPGVEHFIEHELPGMKALGTAVIANLGGNGIDEYVEGARLLDGSGIDMLELNISCPNMHAGGAAFGVHVEDARAVVAAVRGVFHGPLMVKLTPNAGDIAAVARACEAAGADCLSLINTVLGMAIDADARRPVFRNVVAGLSGPAVKPLALRMVYDVARAVRIPVVGLGGIASGRDAAEFLLAGATAVQVGTANFTHPAASLRIVEELREYCEQHGFGGPGDIRMAE